MSVWSLRPSLAIFSSRTQPILTPLGPLYCDFLMFYFWMQFVHGVVECRMVSVKVVGLPTICR